MRRNGLIASVLCGLVVKRWSCRTVKQEIKSGVVERDPGLIHLGICLKPVTAFDQPYLDTFGVRVWCVPVLIKLTEHPRLQWSMQD